MLIQARISGNVLRIKIPLQKPKVSASGKSEVIATTKGPQSAGFKHQGSEVFIVANAFIRNVRNNPKPQAQDAADKKRRRP